MNNYTFGYNHNSLAYNPQFSQNEGNNVLQNNQVFNSSPYDIVEIKKSSNNKKSTFKKVLTGLAWIGFISLGFFGAYKLVEYKNTGFFKKTFPFSKRNKFVEEKSSKERSFLQKFNDLFKDCKVKDPQKTAKREIEYIECAFKNREISETEKIKLEEKIKIRRKIRELNSIYNTQIPLTPYGGVEQIFEAACKIKDENTKNKFNEILDYKIEKLEAKLDLLKKRQALKNDKDLAFFIKANRTNDLIESLKEIKEGNLNPKCFYVDYKEQYIKDKVITEDSYNIRLENELGNRYSINLSSKTFCNMFKDKKMISQKISDCYLVGTINAIINNPKHRCEFYQMFSEDEKFIIFTFKDGFKVKFLKDNNGKPKLLNNQHELLDSSSMGYQMFEEAYALHRLYERAKNGYKNIQPDKNIENTIKDYAQKDDKLDKEFNTIISQSGKYIDGKDKTYASILDGGTIYEVANALFNSKKTSYYLKGYHNYENNLLTKNSKSDDEISQILTTMINEGKSIVVGRDEFKVNGNEEKYKYNGIDIHNSHFSVVRYYNSKTKEVHIFESNAPDKVLILPLSVFNQQYSLLYGF